MKRKSIKRLIALAGLLWLLILGCRTSDVIARANPPGDTATATATTTRSATVRPTFTIAPPTPLPTETPPPPTPIPPPVPTPRPVVRVPTVPPKSPTPVPPPPTADPYAGYYYRPVNKGCVSAPNTRIQGTVYENGAKKNGVKVRVSHAYGAEPSIDDFITGNDPRDFKHYDPSLQGQYMLALFEGQRNAGNWWVFVIDGAGNPLSPGVLVTTQDGGGCNTATIDFVH